MKTSMADRFIRPSCRRLHELLGPGVDKPNQICGLVLRYDVDFEVVVAQHNGEWIEAAHLLIRSGWFNTTLTQQFGQLDKVVSAPGLDLMNKQDSFERFFDSLLGMETRCGQVDIRCILQDVKGFDVSIG
jgi:hypothetical protein